MTKNTISIGDSQITPRHFTVAAGPCSVESVEQFSSVVKFLKNEKISLIRGGLFKPRTSPQNFQGLGPKAFPIVSSLKKKENFIFITEITHPRQIAELKDIADVFQVGTRNMFNYELLKDLSKIKKPILLKRSFSARVEEWLLAAEYLAQGGNDQIILCERGIRTFETAYRNVLDLNAVSYLKERCPYPVFVDPSHSAGESSLVSDLAQAAFCAGADGLLIEVHPEPKKALSDGRQALTFDLFSQLMKNLRNLSQTLPTGPYGKRTLC